jgi:hypothetical protein
VKPVAKKSNISKNAIFSEEAIGGSLVADRPNHHFRSSTSLFRVKGRAFQFRFNRRQLHHPLSFQFWLKHARIS